MAIPIVLDCDTGTDDAVAIMLAALHREIDLVAVTTVNGNVPVQYCTDNSLRVLDHIGRSDIPVYEGCAEPIVRRDFPVAREQRRDSELHGLHLDLPPARTGKQDRHAAEFLASRFAAAGGGLTLVATGPLTNVALAIKLDPAFARNVRRLVIMGGGHEVGNVTPSAEFNVWADPEAARSVLQSEIAEIVLVPLDATHQALVGLGDCQALRDLKTPAGDATALLVERRIHAYDRTQPMARAGAAPVHDALCIAYLIQPEVLGGDRYFVEVETAGQATVGRTVIDTHRRSRREPNAWVALSADGSAFVDLLRETFRRSG